MGRGTSRATITARAPRRNQQMSQAARREYRRQTKDWYERQIAQRDRQFNRPNLRSELTVAEKTRYGLDPNQRAWHSAEHMKARRAVLRGQIRERQANLRDSYRRGLSPGQAQARLTRLENRQGRIQTTARWTQGTGRYRRSYVERVQGGVVNNRYRPTSMRTERQVAGTNRPVETTRQRASRLAQNRRNQRAANRAMQARWRSEARQRARDARARGDIGWRAETARAAQARSISNATSRNTNRIQTTARQMEAAREARTAAANGGRQFGRSRSYRERASDRRSRERTVEYNRRQRAEQRSRRTAGGERPNTPPSRMSNRDRRWREANPTGPYRNRSAGDRAASARAAANRRATARGPMSARERRYFQTYGYRAADGSRQYGRPPAAVLIRYRSIQRRLNSQLHQLRKDSGWYNRNRAREAARRKRLRSELAQRLGLFNIQIIDPVERRKQQQRERNRRRG